MPEISGSLLVLALLLIVLRTVMKNTDKRHDAVLRRHRDIDARWAKTEKLLESLKEKK